MIGTGKRWSAGLQPINAFDPEFECIEKVIPPGPAILYTLPIVFGFYPLEGVNQAILTWFLAQLPNNASYVDVTPVNFHGVITDKTLPLGTQRDPGLIVGGLGVLELYRYQWDEFVIGPPDIVITHPLRYRKTAPDATLTLDGNTINDGTQHQFQVGGTHLGFLVEHDGDDPDPSGVMTLHLDLTWA